MGCSADTGLFESRLPRGVNNTITDVAGVTVGHCTINEGDIKTGVTAILPHPGNIYREKLPAGHAVFNGFGKSTGLMQLAELGTLETPIILTNTLNVGTAFSAVVRYSLEKNKDIGVKTGTVNPVICECNDGQLSDIRGMHIAEEHVFEAIRNAGTAFEEGNAGAGCGMSCYGFKGGIGSASRVLTVGRTKYTTGVLVLTNYGNKQDFRIMGHRVAEKQAPTIDKGSVIVIIATDAPLTDRQLNRVSRRAVAGLCRSGATIGHGSGELAIGFSTAYRIPHYAASGKPLEEHPNLHESYMDHIFAATVESVEDAVFSSLIHAETTTGIRGKRIVSLTEFLQNGEQRTVLK